MKSIVPIVVLLFLGGCSQDCNEDLLVGEQLAIPLNLSNYSLVEASQLHTIIVKNDDTTEQMLQELLVGQNLENPALTDQTPNGYYSSNMDGANLYFFELNAQKEKILKDSLTDIVVLKSQGEVDDPCYEDDPNVQIDHLSFVHDGKTKGENDVVIVKK